MGVLKVLDDLNHPLKASESLNLHHIGWLRLNCHCVRLMEHYRSSRNVTRDSEKYYADGSIRR
jgi:hypothetical protein